MVGLVMQAHQLFCAQTPQCQWCMPLLQQTLEAASDVMEFSVKLVCDDVGSDYDTCKYDPYCILMQLLSIVIGAYY